MKQWLRLATLVMTVILTGCSHNAYTNNSQGYYSEAELDQMLAPIALYPDVILSQVLMASTYQPEVEEAAGWSQQNRHLRGTDAVNAVSYYEWDPSVKALVTFPDLLEQMAENPDWTWRVGDAYLSQEQDVMASIQRLRMRAYRSGNLNRLDHLRVYNDGGYVIIEPNDPALVYLPYYQPLTVYGEWGWPSYPPHYWRAPRGYSSGVSFYWGSGISVGTGFFYSGFQWPQRHVIIYDRRDYRPYRHQGYYKHYHNPQRWHHQSDRNPNRHQYDYRRGREYGGRDGYQRSPGGFRGDWERQPGQNQQHRDNRRPYDQNQRNQDWDRQRNGDYRRDQNQRNDYRRDDPRRDGYQRDGNRQDNRGGSYERDRQHQPGNLNNQGNSDWRQRRDNAQPGFDSQRSRPEQHQQRGSDIQQPRGDGQRDNNSGFRPERSGGGFRPENRDNLVQPPAANPMPAERVRGERNDNRRQDFNNQRERPDFSNRQERPEFNSRPERQDFNSQRERPERQANPEAFQRPQRGAEPMPDQGRQERRQERFEMPRENRQERVMEAPAPQVQEAPSQVERHQNRGYDQPRPERQGNPRSWQRESGGGQQESSGNEGGFGGEQPQ